MNHAALVLFSGGQDSTLCLAWALARFDRVETVGFDYGQRHHIELTCRPKILARIKTDFPEWADKLDNDHMLDLAVLGKISETSLTREKQIAFDRNGVPNTFVPGRNLLFFTFAAAIAYRRETEHLVGGMCETDYSGYPDCRKDTLESQQETLRKGMDYPFEIHAPLMHLDKAASWALTHDIGGNKLVELIRTETHSCYLGERGTLHSWGYGCGTCPACTLRAEGYKKYTKAA